MSENFDALGAALTQSIPPMLTALEAMEVAQQAYHPARPNAVAEFPGAYTQGLEEAIAALAPHQFPEHVRQFETHLKTCLKYAARSTDNFSQVVNDDLAFLRASRTLCKAREALFPLATLLNPIHQFFLEPSLRQSTEISDHWLTEAEQSPISHIENDYTERGGASIYIPHNLNTDEPTPLVISLHGGGGHGRNGGGGGGRGCRPGGSAEVTEAPAMKPAATAATAVLLAPASSGALPSTPLDFPEELCFPLLPFCIKIVDRACRPAVARPSEVGSSGAA